MIRSIRNLRINRYLAQAKRQMHQQQLHRYCSKINWPYAEIEVLAYLRKIAAQLNSEPNQLYWFQTDSGQCDQNIVRKISLIALRKQPVPKLRPENPSSAKKDNAGYDNEGVAALTFTESAQGLISVTLQPHTSSLSGPTRESPYFLATYDDSEKLRRDALQGLLAKYIRLYLPLQRASSFDNFPSRKTSRILRKLATRDGKIIDLYPSDQERKIESHRVNWALGVAAASSLLGVSFQSLSGLFISKESNPLAFISVAVLLLVTFSILIALKNLGNK